jgi:DNA-binding Lrp family transcriptional regulator
MKALESAGYLKGYHADVDAQALGFEITIFTEVGLESQTAAELHAFADIVVSWPMVRECHVLTGKADFLLKVVVEDWATYQKFITTDLGQAARINYLKSSLAIRTCKRLPGVPICVEPQEMRSMVLDPSPLQRHSSGWPGPRSRGRG